jgi:conjugal transfer pilus assembly protein TraW
MAYLLIALFLFFPSLHARDFGTFGTTFDIEEKDFIEVLKNRLEAAQLDDGKKEEIKKAVTQQVERPQGKNLPRALTWRSFEYDPTLCVYEDIKDHNNKIIIPKGTKINPLKRAPLQEDLIFFDGDDQLQVQWAKNLKGKWILSNGNPLELEEKEAKAVYFDQSGYLISKLGIQFLPAKVTQKGDKLLVEEIPCF